MAASPIKTWTKDPVAVLDYHVRWRKWLKGDTISSIVVTAGAGITLDSSSFAGDTVTIWLSGGTDTNTYLVAIKIVTVGGRTDERTVAIRAASRVTMLSDIEMELYDHFGHGDNPPSEVVNRFRRNINTTYREILGMKGLSKLRRAVLPFVSVANSPYAVLPQAAARIITIHDR